MLRACSRRRRSNFIPYGASKIVCVCPAILRRRRGRMPHLRQRRLFATWSQRTNEHTYNLSTSNTSNMQKYYYCIPCDGGEGLFLQDSRVGQNASFSVAPGVLFTLYAHVHTHTCGPGSRRRHTNNISSKSKSSNAQFASCCVDAPPNLLRAYLWAALLCTNMQRGLFFLNLFEL